MLSHLGGERQPLLEPQSKKVSVFRWGEGPARYVGAATIVVVTLVGLLSAVHYINVNTVPIQSTPSLLASPVATNNLPSVGSGSPPPIEVVFVLGGPGAGKGTQCENIVRYYEWMHLSMGDLLRAEQAKGGPLADVIGNCMKEGKLVPGELTVELLKNEMARQAKLGMHRFLIDGFPRNRENLVDWEKLIGPVEHANATAAEHRHPLKSFAQVRFVLFFDCPESTMLERCLHRGETSGRVDDNEEAVKKRFVTYNEETKPILDAFNQWGIVKTISAVPSVDEVFNAFKYLFAGSERAVPLPAAPSNPAPTLMSAWADPLDHHRVMYGCPNPNL